MLWAVLLPTLDETKSLSVDALSGISLWCLQFTPRVAILEASAVGMELAGSERLFGGKRKLVERVREESAELGVSFLSWAPTSLAGLALARAGVRNGFAKSIAELLDSLPLSSLRTVFAHAPTLARLGCQNLGHVRALPRGGVSRRFDKDLLAAMDQAYGLRPEGHSWVTLPETFSARLELMSRVDTAPAMLFGARRLLMQLCGWLSARRAGIVEFTLRWCHDVMRSKTAGDGGELTIRTAEPTRQLEHLSRLLAENLSKVELLAPAGDLELIAVDVRAFEGNTTSLLPDSREDTESLALVLERIAARLGPERVRRPVLHEDHRMEWQVHWQPAATPLPRQLPKPSVLPQPAFILPKPLKLATREDRPLYQGMLVLVSGPHRVESGWWHRLKSTDGSKQAQIVLRDYYVAVSEHAGALWVFQTRMAREETSWYLHGVFA